MCVCVLNAIVCTPENERIKNKKKINKKGREKYLKKRERKIERERECGEDEEEEEEVVKALPTLPPGLDFSFAYWGPVIDSSQHSKKKPSGRPSCIR